MSLDCSCLTQKLSGWLVITC